jgi:hypothetical protein
MKRIKKYINFNNYEDEKEKEINFEIGDIVFPITNVYFFDHFSSKWRISQIKSPVKIIKIKKCHELKSDRHNVVYRIPCDKDENLVLFHSFWAWYSLKGFKKLEKNK